MTNDKRWDMWKKYGVFDLTETNVQRNIDISQIESPEIYREMLCATTQHLNDTKLVDWGEKLELQETGGKPQFY